MSDDLAREDPAQEPSKSLEEIVRLVAARLNDGSISFDALLKAVAPKEPLPEAAKPVPSVAVITHAQRAAIGRLNEVFGKVVPTAARKLQPAEVSDLVEEKRVLDQLKKLVEDRHEGMRTTVFNHLDIEAEEGGLTRRARLDKRGHFVLPGEALAAPGTGQKFTREVREGTIHLNHDTLKGLVDRPDLDFTHEDYLAMTTQVRDVDEHKIMLALKKKPSLINVIAEATERGAPVASLYLRKE